MDDADGQHVRDREGTVATLGEWHHRPGGEWRIDSVVFRMANGREHRRYEWTAAPMDAEGRGTPTDERRGVSRFAFLARRRAISALAKMRRDTDEGGR